MREQNASFRHVHGVSAELELPRNNIPKRAMDNWRKEKIDMLNKVSRGFYVSSED